MLLTKQFRAIQANITPDSDKEICRYRDRSINGLNRLLANPETQLCDETLDAIIMLLMAEVSASSTVHRPEVLNFEKRYSQMPRAPGTTISTALPP